MIFKSGMLILTGLIFLSGCNFSSNDYQFPYEYDGNIYLCKNGDITEFLEKEKVNDPGDCYNQFFDPCLSRDGTKLCCVRFNHDCHLMNDSDKMILELVLVDLQTKALTVLAATNHEMNEIFSPDWSADGGKIYFFGDKIIYSYDLQTDGMHEFASFPEDQTATWLNEYLRVSLDGKRVYAFLRSTQLESSTKEGLKKFVWSI